jgi:DHA1 family tetracycline resistance protein-like MFS transporter
MTLDRGMAPDRVRSTLPMLAGLALLDGLSVGLFIPLMPFLVLHLGGGPAVVTQLVAFYALAAFVANPVMGRLSDGLGRGLLLRLSLAGSIVAYCGMLVSWSLVGVAAFYLLGGVLSGRSAVLPALATDGAPPDQHVQQLSWLAAAGAFGVAAGPLLTTAITAVVAEPEQQFRVTLLGSALLLALAFLISFLLTPGRRRAHASPAGENREGAGAARGMISALRRPLMLAFATAYAYAVVMTLTGLLVHARFGWGAGATGLILGLFAVGVALSRAALLNPLVKWLGMERALAACLLVAAPTLVGIAAATSPVLLVALIALFSVAGELAILLPASMVSVAAPEEKRGLAMGLVVATAALATFASALSTGVLFERVGPGAPFLVGAGVVVLGIVLLAIPSRSGAAPPAGADAPDPA